MVHGPCPVTWAGIRFWKFDPLEHKLQTVLKCCNDLMTVNGGRGGFAASAAAAIKEEAATPSPPKWDGANASLCSNAVYQSASWASKYAYARPRNAAPE